MPSPLCAALNSKTVQAFSLFASKPGLVTICLRECRQALRGEGLDKMLVGRKRSLEPRFARYHTGLLKPPIK